MYPVPIASMPATGRALRLFKTWFWRPPRPHGDTIIDRRVSPLELLYDLVYVAVISQAGRNLAQHVSLTGLADFAVVFSLTWIAWTNAPSTSNCTVARTAGRAHTCSCRLASSRSLRSSQATPAMEVALRSRLPT